MTTDHNVLTFETSKFYCIDDLYLFVVSWVFGAMIFSNSLQSMFVNAIFVFVFLSLFFGVLYLRKQYIFRDYFKSRLSYNKTTKSLQIDEQIIAKKDILTAKVWTVRGIDRCLEIQLQDQTVIRVLSPKAKKVLELIQ
jgi:hypothetical protein